ncbi:hypothetical protein [Sinorhizobium mexicanum]|uniref:Uncharacterized protein n=1 Tax=Sinorhizobium mexicanum TaxID=375549 RepID=A0A859QER0_9HYPH|nr:hypothetical protein [Sinorhizobium mexicanum]MBP1881930.1 hypothetical protein [Sinorhizobium mexicanum]QLL61664.1 hypothetical protein FKV68_09505 [Sinorhizobium mexicanum]
MANGLKKFFRAGDGAIRLHGCANRRRMPSALMDAVENRPTLFPGQTPRRLEMCARIGNVAGIGL